MNLFFDPAGGIDDEAEEPALNLATHAAIALSGVRRNGQFRSALASRDLNGQAKGRLMERFDLDAIAAFRMIRALSREMNSPVIGIARQLAFREPLTPDNT
ncbi:ANTAR domain-containing protein [Rhodococcus sp. YH3-3]|uniref:ANTAR domain-containing protein n=1 Tax=Rhodococcus sp. YH3-3 TaxID=1803579 RepID=UPI0007DB5DC9|nr:ANTAR domain-containing protein [Rhodococcus sp. YH3-3]